jgi:hypothetical protein
MQAQATATIEPKPEQAQPLRRAPRARACEELTLTCTALRSTAGTRPRRAGRCASRG